MSPLIVVAAVCGAGFGAGLWLTIDAFRPRTAPPHRGAVGMASLTGWLQGGRRARLAAAVAAGLLTGAVTGWPVAAVLAGLAVWALPPLLGPDTAHTRRLARIEAVATWTEGLRDTLSAAAGLEQSILATAPAAPVAIRPEVQGLAAAIRRGERLPPALRRLADDLAGPLADLVVAALILAAQRQGRALADLLGSLAAAAREQAGMRLRTAASRARVRTTVRVIVATTLVMAAGLIVLNRGYLAPYDSTIGQLVLLLIGALFAAGFWWLSRISTLTEAPRYLTGLDAIGHQRAEVTAP